MQPASEWPARSRERTAWICLAVSSLFLGATIPACRAAEKPGEVAEPEALLERIVEMANRKRQGPVVGEDGWLFLPSEFEALDAKSVPQESKRSDPVGAIAAFREQLEARSVHLLVVPVPLKVTVYPDQLDRTLSARGPRIDVPILAILDRLRARNVDVIDLLPAYLSARADDADPLYVAGDSHWSPRGALVAARAVREHLASLPSLRDHRFPTPEPQFLAEKHGVEGDLRGLLLPRTDLRDQIWFHRPLASLPSAPERSRDIALLGDSHLLVWRARQSGFADQLESLLALPLQQIAVQAGGPTASRRALARRTGWLDGRKVLIWLFAARQFLSGPAWEAVELTSQPDARSSPASAAAGERSSEN